jgi:hypothetical protein
MDGYALSTSRRAVEVVEVAGQALVEDGGAHEGQRAVAAETEALGLLSTLLDGAVELELKKVSLDDMMWLNLSHILGRWQQCIQYDQPGRSACHPRGTS